MVVPAFGFSIGDFVTGIHLLIQIYQALHDSSKAKEEIQSALAFLDLLSQIFKRFERFNSAERLDPELLPYLEPSIRACINQASRFLETIKKYELSGDESNKAKRRRHRAVREAKCKLQWKLFAKGDLAKIQAEITFHVSNILSLLQMCEMEAHHRPHCVQTLLLEQTQDAEITLITDADISSTDDASKATANNDKRNELEDSTELILRQESYSNTWVVQTNSLNDWQLDFQALRESLQTFFTALV